MMFALLVSTPFGDYEAIIFPKKAMELSPILLEKDIFWVVGKIEESQKSSTDKLDEEGKSTEYEQKPKILIDSMAPLEGDLLELLTKPTSVNNRQKQHNELSEASKKRIEALSIKDFLNTQITPADETNKTGLGNAQQKPIPNEPANSPKVIRIYQKYSMDLVKKIKSLLKSSEEKGLSQVTIEVQTDKEEWKKAKGSFWVDMTLLESLDTHD
ncbi:hypothetical protein HC766_06105 [Candidatus Gracilibacteria bacterium]|nr:hypothetical protein [Candidatus Gracilibacteria bacterium]